MNSITNPENVTESAGRDDAITEVGYAFTSLTWTGMSKGALAEIDRELKEQRDNAMVPPDWKRKRHNRKRGR